MKIIVSFSGGRTSAYMGWWLKHHTDHELKFVFMNTGCEHEETLKFLDRCDKEWNLDLVWIEGVYNHAGRGHGFGTTHRVVDFKTAKCAHDTVDHPFEEAIKKYGIPNASFPNCSMHTKEEPYNSYRRDNKLGGWVSAIGIRADEFDRINPNHVKAKLIYPLVTMHPTTENDIMHWWSRQDFNLGIHQFEGNCTWCWKKSFRKLATIAKDNPEHFDFPARMEKLYHDAGPNGRNGQVFFRKMKSTQDVLDMANDTIPFNPSPVTQPDMFWDETGGCSESCEVFS